MCAVALGRADLRSNPEFLQFRQGFDIVLTGPDHDLHSLIGVSTWFRSITQWARVDTLPLVLYPVTDLEPSGRIHFGPL